MSRFLKEVKEMLQKELKAANATTSDLDTTAWGAAEPKQIARDIAKQTKESFTKDLSKRLSRSESFRAFRGDRKRKEATTTKLQASPEHVRILTRSILAHRLESVASRTETVSSPRKDDEESMSSCSITSRERVRSLADVSPSPSGIGIGFGVQSFRSECLMRHKDDSVSSARALFRSFSAPESGFSLGRLFGDGSARSSTHEASEGHAAMTCKNTCNQDKAYIREVLVAAGLYDDGSLDNKANARLDSMARPICDDTFEEVEDIYYYRGNYCDDAIGMYSGSGGNAMDHRMLFDLANEALQSLVQAAKTGSSLQQWVIDSTGVSRGRRLVDDVWQQVQTLRNPQMQEMQTIDSMVAYEIRKSSWAEVLYEDVYVVGRKVERAIFDELIEDLLVEAFI
ncbi:unnamed protein product [Urochloa decumbens]|uniref:DUF4378 domain-containing protein n=1 Tax=Urochloa decumbens TaxID=240449 RepID=A0ABC9HA06_9POAL